MSDTTTETAGEARAWLTARGLQPVAFAGRWIGADGAVGNYYYRAGAWHAWHAPRHNASRQNARHDRPGHAGGKLSRCPGGGSADWTSDIEEGR